MSQADIVKILKKLREGEYFTTSEIAKKLKIKRSCVNLALNRMLKYKEVEKIELKTGYHLECAYRLSCNY